MCERAASARFVYPPAASADQQFREEAIYDEIKLLTARRRRPILPSDKELVRTAGNQFVTLSRYGWSMPRYFFNTRIGSDLILDPEGEVLRDPDHAWQAARTTIREILRTDGEQRGILNAVLEVTDDSGEIVLEFPFTEAILDRSEPSSTRH